jgi:aryl-alcohol dehydrogenase-like predicted oxidoreductase
MQYTRLGRTELQVSVAGLGCGGPSRLGRTYGSDESASIAVVRRALELGVNFIDTAIAYGTEGVVGKAIAGRTRGDVIVSSKVPPADAQGLLTPERLRQGLERSLKQLGSDYVDIYHLHGVGLDQYPHCREHQVPALLELQREGKIRFLGITERFGADPGHAMLEVALEDDCWDVIMTGFNLLNPSARERVFARTRAKGIGTLIMFAVRRALSRPESLEPVMAELIRRGVLREGELDPAGPLDFLVHPGGASSVVEAAYRFCRHEPGADVILTGTGNVAHLEDNLRSLQSPPLPPGDLARLEALFGKVDFISAN